VPRLAANRSENTSTKLRKKSTMFIEVENLTDEEEREERELEKELGNLYLGDTRMR